MLVELGHLPVLRGDWANDITHGWGFKHGVQRSNLWEGIKIPAETSDGGETLLADVQYGNMNKLPWSNCDLI